MREILGTMQSEIGFTLDMDHQTSSNINIRLSALSGMSETKPGHDIHQLIVDPDDHPVDCEQSVDEHEYQHLGVHQQQKDRGRGYNDQRKGHDLQQEQDYVECVHQVDEGHDSD